MQDLSDAALVLVGHGSTLNSDSSRPTYQHADALRGRGIFGQVLECFWKQEPAVGAVLRGVFARRIFIVPLFISEGYFTEQVIPRELGFSDGQRSDFKRTQIRGEQTLYYCGPIGTHESMTAVLLARASEIVEQFPFPRSPTPAESSLFIAGHGTGNNENSRKAIEHQVEKIRQIHRYASVHDIYMEEEPRIPRCYDLAAAANLVVVPFFISDGLHSYEDIPVMLGESAEAVRGRLNRGQRVWRNPTEKRGKRVWYAASIGNEPRISEVILERVEEAAHA